MDRMTIIMIDQVLQRYIEAARQDRDEKPNEILRRLLKLDKVPIATRPEGKSFAGRSKHLRSSSPACLLYTSDAADE